MLYTLALRIRTYSRVLGTLLVVPLLVGAVGPILAGQAKDATTTVFVQLFIAPQYRPYVLLLISLLLLVVLIEILASREEQRNGSKDLRNYLKEMVKKHEALAPDGFFQTSALASVEVPLDTVFIHVRAISDRPRFDVPHELQEALTTIQRRTDLSLAQQEERIQALRVRWYSQLGGTSLASPERVQVEKILQHATAQKPGVVILGSPGSGKSTTLRWLAFHMARAATLPPYRRLLALLARLLSRLLNHSSHFLPPGLSRFFRRAFRWGDDLPVGLGPCQIPLLFKVGEYAKALTPDAPLVSVQKYLASFLAETYENLPNLAKRLLQELEQGRCLVLIDGLDEVANDHLRRQVTERITAFCEHYAPDTRRFNRFLITSRIVGYEANKFTNYTHYTLQDLNDEQIDDFLSHWCPAVERYRMQAAQSSKKLSAEQQAQADQKGRSQYQRLRDALKQNPGIKNLAVNPLMLTLLALLQQSGRTLPHRRIELYQMVTRTLLDNWNQQTGRRVFPPDEIPLAEEMLSHLAYEMHTSDLLLTEKQVREIAGNIMAAFYKREPTREQIAQFIDTIRGSSGLFVEGGQGLFCFMHRTFQEYYVAQQLKTTSFNELRDLVQQHCHHSIWHEPFLLLIAEKSAQQDQEASDLIRTILHTSKSYDTVLQRHVLLATRCVIDCNVWRIEHALQRTLAKRLFTLYGDSFGDGRYAPLQQEIKRLMLLWLRGQPSESSSALPPLLAVWRESLCDDSSALYQEGAVRLLSNLARDLLDCPKLALASLLPPLVVLAGLLELPDFPIPAEIHHQCATLRIRPASIQITEYALITLRLLDNEGPAGWLHRAWLAWNEKQPELLQRLSQHALELDHLLTPAAFPATYEDVHWDQQLALSQNWQKHVRRNLGDLQTKLLQASTAARFPHSYLYWQMLKQEATVNPQDQDWRASWQAFLKKEMERGQSATYQTCFHLRLLLGQRNSQQRSAIVSEMTLALSSQNQQHMLAMIALSNTNLQVLRYMRDMRYLLDFLDMRDMRYLLDFLDMRDIRDMRYLLDLRDIRDLRYLRGLMYLLDLRDLIDIREVVLSLCQTLVQGNTKQTIISLLVLSSLIEANQQLLSELRQPVEQVLQRFKMMIPQQSIYMKEQRYLIKAIRQQIHPVAETQPASRSASKTTPEERASALEVLKQRSQLSKADMEELLDACGDEREIVEENTRMRKSGVERRAWSLLSHPFNLSNEAWMVLQEALEHPEPLLCAAATRVFQANKHVPSLVRKQAIPSILRILYDETLEHRSLRAPDGQRFYLDDELFQTLQILVEQDEKDV